MMPDREAILSADEVFDLLYRWRDEYEQADRDALIAHDAALRARIAALTEERDRLRAVVRDPGERWLRMVERVAVLTEERDAARRVRDEREVAEECERLALRAERAEARVAVLEAGLRDTTRAIDDLIAWMKRYRAGDTTLNPEEWFIESEYAANVATDARALLGGVLATKEEQA